MDTDIFISLAMPFSTFLLITEIHYGSKHREEKFRENWLLFLVTDDLCNYDRQKPGRDEANILVIDSSISLSVCNILAQISQTYDTLRIWVSLFFVPDNYNTRDPNSISETLSLHTTVFPSKMDYSGLAFVLILGPFFHELVMSMDLLSFQHSSVLLFDFIYQYGAVQLLVQYE